MSWFANDNTQRILEHAIVELEVEEDGSVWIWILTRPHAYASARLLGPMDYDDLPFWLKKIARRFQPIIPELWRLFDVSRG